MSTSDDDLALVKRAYDLLNSDTYEQVLPLVDERFVMVTTRAVASEPDTYRGPEGVRRWWVSFLDAMDSVRLQAQRFEPAGEGQVIVEFTIHARGQRSGIDTQQPGIALATVESGLLLRLEFFTDLEQARAAARPQPH